MTRVWRDPWRGTRLGHPSAATIATCTALRRSGDWRGACAAAGFHVDVDIDETRARYGKAAARQLEADLRALAPDLLWQYLPDAFHQLTVWHDGITLSRLARPLGAPSAPALTVALPREPDVLCRPRISVGGPDQSRQLWSARQWPVWCWRADAVAERRDAYATLDHRVVDEVDGLTDGRVSPDELHPLVHEVLYPGRVQAPVVARWEWPAVRVRCGGLWHEVQIGGGRLNTLEHGDAELARELTLGALGGAVAGCAEVVRAWRTGRGRLPRRLRWQRAAFFRHAYYGHTDDVLAMLDAGFDIAARDGTGATLVHYLGRLDHRRLWPRLREAGLSLETRDHEGRTALAHLVYLQAEEAIALLLEAGADPHAADAEGIDPIGRQRRWVEPRRRSRRSDAARQPHSSILARLGEAATA